MISYFYQYSVAIANLSVYNIPNTLSIIDLIKNIHISILSYINDRGKIRCFKTIHNRMFSIL